MFDKETQDYLFSLRRRGIKIGLHRTEALLAKCGNPHNHIPVIHIAGTNGKGSIAVMIARILQEAGKKVGLYTSPHLIRFNERIRVNGIPISDEQITDFLDQYRPIIDSLGATFFETTTALTFTHFVNENVDIAVVEVGLGGRLDSTNISKPVLTILTPIDYDHMEFLGHNLISIAKEKCGIIKPHIPVLSSNQHTSVWNVLEKTVKKTQSDLFLSTKLAPIQNPFYTPLGSTFSINGTEYQLSLIGKHQIKNAQIAIAACMIYDPHIEPKYLQHGIMNVFWPGRLQKMAEEPLVYYDVAHNPHGLQAVLKTIQELFPTKIIGTICALKKTKNVRGLAEHLKIYSKKVITTAPNHGDFFTPISLSKEFEKAEITAFPAITPYEALTFSQKKSYSKDRIWLIWGTHYLAKEVYNYFHFLFDNVNI